MLHHEAFKLAESHREWLQQNTTITPRGEYVEIGLPFLDRRNDYICIYLRKDDDGFILSDCGETLDELGIEGFEATTPRRKQILDQAISGFGVTNDKGVLKVRTTLEGFGCSLNNLIQAILSVNDLHILSTPISTTNFRLNVVSWLKENFAQISENKKIVGKSGLEHSFHYTFAEGRRNSTQVFMAINSPTIEAARNLVFSWIDTREKHFPDSRAIAILNDRHQEIPRRTEEVLSRYEISSVPWSQRNEFLEHVMVIS